MFKSLLILIGFMAFEVVLFVVRHLATLVALALVILGVIFFHGQIGTFFHNLLA